MASVVVLLRAHVDILLWNGIQAMMTLHSPLRFSTSDEALT